MDVIPEPLHFQPKQLSILLTVVALALWAVSITRANLVLDDWGLIHSLPVTYFVALGLLTVAAGILWLSKESHNFLMGLQLVFFIGVLWLTPLLLGTRDMSLVIIRILSILSISAILMLLRNGFIAGLVAAYLELVLWK
jgi:hypothetical protein